MAKRFSVNKRRSVSKFKRSASRTKYANVQPTPTRGGFKL